MPSYFIFGGFVFSPLTLITCALELEQWWYTAPVELRYHLIMDIATRSGSRWWC